MAHALLLPPTGFDDLTVDEKLDYVQSLWDHIMTQPEKVPVPDWHHRVLQERLAAHRTNPGDAQSLEEARAGVAEKLRQHRSREA